MTDGPETVGHQTGRRTRLRPALSEELGGDVRCGSRLYPGSDRTIQIHGSTAVVFRLKRGSQSGRRPEKRDSEFTGRTEYLASRSPC